MSSSLLATWRMSADSSLPQAHRNLLRRENSRSMRVKDATTLLAPGLPDDHLYNVGVFRTA